MITFVQIAVQELFYARWLESSNSLESKDTMITADTWSSESLERYLVKKRNRCLKCTIMVHIEMILINFGSKLE